MSDENGFDGFMEDADASVDLATKVSKGFFPKTLGLFDDALYNWLKPKLTKKQSDNLIAHLDGAAGTDGMVIDGRATELSDVTALIEWVDGVKDIDPEIYPRTAEIWQEAIVQIAKGNRDVLSAAQRIKPETIERFPDNRAITLDDAIELEKLGLGKVSKPYYLDPSDDFEIKTFLFTAICVGGVYTAIWVLLNYLFESPEGRWIFWIGMSLVALAWSHGLFKSTPILNPFFKFFLRPKQRFFPTFLGSHTLNTVLGENPNSDPSWVVSPVELARSSEYFAKDRSPS